MAIEEFRQINPEELNRILEEHKFWSASAGEKGKQMVQRFYYFLLKICFCTFPSIILITINLNFTG